MDPMQKSPLFLAFALALIALELVRRRRAGRGYDGRAALASAGVAAGQIISGALGAAIIVPALTALWLVAPVKWPLDDWRLWIAGFFAYELAYYWQHRLSHTVRWFWATHSVHHTANEFVLPAAFRLGWTAGISGVWLPIAPLALIGMPPLMILTLTVVNLRYQFLLHTEEIGRLGPLEWVLNTPSHHRVHHGSNPAYLDRNFGGVLIVFDRLFGTFAAERPDEPVRYGLTTPVRSNNPFVIALQGWRDLWRDLRAARNAGEILHSLFGRPSDAAGSATPPTRARP